MRLGFMVALLPFVGSTFAQTVEYCDTPSDICFQAYQEPQDGILIGAAFPEDTTSTEFIGIMVAPKTQGWVGYSLTGGMLNTLVIMAWPYQNGFVSSTRLSLDYVLPAYFSGPIVTTLPSSSTNETHWKYIFRCQKCTSWSWAGGNNTIDPSFQVQSWAAATSNVTDPSSTYSSFAEHTSFGYFAELISNARTADYAKYLNATA